jgi:Domain of unknown function (DUF4167)
MAHGNNNAKNKNRRTQRPSANRPVSGSANGRQQPANAKQRYERYVALAKAAEQAGDPVQSEYYYQHAEHYLRTMKEHGRAV